MKTKLSQLTMAQYIDMLIDAKTLLDKHEFASEQSLERARREIMFEYVSIADAGTAKSALYSSARIGTEKSRRLFFGNCLKLMRLGEEDAVRSLLKEYGLNPARYQGTERLLVEIRQQLLRSDTNLTRMTKEAEERITPTGTDIRKIYDRQAASLMVYFKFQIDINTISATQFAYMVEQANRQIKATRAAMKK